MEGDTHVGPAQAPHWHLHPSGLVRTACNRAHQGMPDVERSVQNCAHRDFSHQRVSACLCISGTSWSGSGSFVWASLSKTLEPTPTQPSRAPLFRAWRFMFDSDFTNPVLTRNRQTAKKKKRTRDVAGLQDSNNLRVGPCSSVQLGSCRKILARK